MDSRILIQVHASSCCECYIILTGFRQWVGEDNLSIVEIIVIRDCHWCDNNILVNAVVKSSVSVIVSVSTSASISASAFEADSVALIVVKFWLGLQNKRQTLLDRIEKE